MGPTERTVTQEKDEESQRLLPTNMVPQLIRHSIMDERGNAMNSYQSIVSSSQPSNSTTQEPTATCIHPADELANQLDALSLALHDPSQETYDLGEAEYHYIKSTLGLSSPEDSDEDDDEDEGDDNSPNESNNHFPGDALNDRMSSEFSQHLQQIERHVYSDPSMTYIRANHTGAASCGTIPENSSVNDLNLSNVANNDLYSYPVPYAVPHVSFTVDHPPKNLGTQNNSSKLGDTYSVPLSSTPNSNLAMMQKKVASSNNLMNTGDFFYSAPHSFQTATNAANKQKKYSSSHNLMNTSDWYHDMKRIKKSASGGAINPYYSGEDWHQLLKKQLSMNNSSSYRKTKKQRRFPLEEGQGDSKEITYQFGGKAFKMIITMLSLSLFVFLSIFALFVLGSIVLGPPSQPIGPYRLVDAHEGEDFFSHYSFYSGPDSVGSNGYVNYVSYEKAHSLGIAKVMMEPTDSDFPQPQGDEPLPDRRLETGREPFVYMGTSPTEEGPRNSIRLEGLKRYNRGLFILDIRHMPAGCATWPAFWLTDEANWPVNGEIDILEGVNTQTAAKTALHSTRECVMDDVPLGVRSGTWDTAVGVPKRNGELDMTIREANDCFVYNPHQWLNQGCVTISNTEGSLGIPLNEKGGGVFVFEWDPINRFMKSWVFTPHSSIPENLREVLRTSRNTSNGMRSGQVHPEPYEWGVPYAYYPIGEGTNCPESHFRNMHIIFNLAFCGSVAGNRFFLDCPELNKQFGSCENYVASNPTDAIERWYWKIRGVYVFQRDWERAWVK